MRPSSLPGWVIVGLVPLLLSAAAARPTLPDRLILRPGQAEVFPLGAVAVGQTYRFSASLAPSCAREGCRAEFELRMPESVTVNKILHAGDPDVTIYLRPAIAGAVELKLLRSAGGREEPVEVRLNWRLAPLAEADRDRIEAEPNNTWREANLIQLGRDVYGTADDVDYLENSQEGKAGLDWFRFEVAEDRPVLVSFQLDLLDRDVSANLRVYTVDPMAAQPVPYLAGKDPMEIIHDRERERYSTHITRTFTKGTYYLEVNANHPAYILRTRVFGVPPYDDPARAVEAGLHSIVSAGDSWFAQVPRAGNIYRRADNIHETGTRCTACHASSFAAEAALAAHRAGYPIRAKSGFQYLMDRIAASPAPLYGDAGLYWQRFIASPLQAQGMQGGILADFERDVAGRESPLVERFAPFLRAAWADQRVLPADELNAVVPVDSKFGFAWRDWRLLNEAARRTGRADFALAAENIARIVCSRAADKRVENLQDRIHRLVAWSLMDRDGFAAKIRRETGALVSLQNADGGWHEADDRPGPSAVYVTGQLVDALMQAGSPRDHPAILKALGYLLSQQQEFGGWFQTTTHENFRTPMRETQYAVMALARANPRPDAPLTSWGNRDEGPPRLPRDDSMVHTLDDLENLWDVPEADRSRFAREIARLLDHPDPLVRASAASCLGRLECTDSAAPLARALADPSKIVWRAAAWALRRLGNQGTGIDAIARALDDPDPAVCRGAVRIFAYHFQGMDARLDLGRRLIERTRDSDLLTRLQAIKSTRQWFYRAADTRFQRAIIEAYLARMAVPDVPVVRKNLSEGLYIMLDENLGGGVSLQRNLAALPDSMRPPVLAARAAVERDVLLGPILTALERGNRLQREGVLSAFDGSFLGGRTYARQPEGALDVGNDREFGFLYEPPLEQVERTFSVLFAASSELSAEAQRQAIRLGSFFKLPGRTENALIQNHLLDALTSSDGTLRETARGVVADELALNAAEADPGRIDQVRRLLIQDEPSGTRSAVLAAVARNSRLSEHPEIRGTIRELIGNDRAATDLLPVLGQPGFTSAERLAVLDRGWSRFGLPQRLAAVGLLLADVNALDQPEPSPRALRLLRRAAGDSSAEVREQLLAGVGQSAGLRSSRASPELFLGALADDAPEIRKLGLSVTASMSSFWDRPDAREHLIRLLIDPDATVRSNALDVVKHHRLAARHSAVARRVKALADDASLQARALALLRAAGLDPAGITSDVILATLRPPDLERFRSSINAIFYQPGPDGHSCANCHASHASLRIAEAGLAKGFTEEQILINYRSALKMVNLGDPQSSLLLRKPLGPQAQGVPALSSSTGLPHVGGPRWQGLDDPAYKSILDWIRQAAARDAGNK